jgi:hypothetical protein
MHSNGTGLVLEYVDGRKRNKLETSRAPVDEQKSCSDVRELGAEEMTPAQIALARHQAGEWKPKIAQKSKPARAG